MKNTLFLLVLLCTLITFNACQKDKKFELESTKTSNERHVATHRNCGMYKHMDALMKNPEYKTRHAAKFEKIKNFSQLRGECTSPVDIPVAVHFQGVSNPDVACLRQLAQSQIAVLNADLNGTNSDISNWTSNAANSFPGVNNGETCVSFCIATRNHPSGYGLTDGEPAVTVNTTNGDSDSNWSGYLNIFVQPNTGVLGYSPLGGSGNGDGVVIDANAFGSGAGCGAIAPQAPYNLGRTLTHELGHYFLLDHIWGNQGGCNEDDGVNDTPVSAQPYYDCPQIGASSCSSTDMHMNYMDYVNDVCMYMFTEGQSSRMSSYISSSLQNLVQNAPNVCGPGNNPPTCTDGIQNGDETGIDCGGANCPPCNPNPTCDDGIQNGDETGVDCGGANCPPCNPTVGCATPSNVQATVLGTTSAELNWDPVTDAIRYRVRYREQGASQWMRVTANANSITVNGLNPATTYEYSVRSVCQGERSPFSDMDEFTTDGGSGCSDTYLRLELTLDDYPEETSWELTDFFGNVLASGGDYRPNQAGSTITEEFCLIDDCYTFTIYDSYGDGICCDYGDGFYEFYDDANNAVIVSDGQFGTFEEVSFCTLTGNQRLNDVKVNKKAKAKNLFRKAKRNNSAGAK